MMSVNLHLCVIHVVHKSVLNNTM